MRGAAYSPPPTEAAEMSHCELEYAQGISQRIPERFKLPPGALGDPRFAHSAMMQVPERIVVSGVHGDSRPVDLDLIQETPLQSLPMRAPPRVLTLAERPLDSLEMDQTAGSQVQSSSMGTRYQTRSRRERSVSENAALGQNTLSSSVVALSPSAPPLRVCPPLSSPEDGQNLVTGAGVLHYIQKATRRAYQQVLEVLDENQRRAYTAFEAPIDDTGLVDASSLRRQIVKLNRRLQLLEEENKDRSKRELILYSATVAFWLVNTWIWFRR